MKKLFLVLVILLFAGGMLCADGINLKNFPVGEWLDPNYNAVWEFTSNNIRILSTDGEVHFDFSEQGVQDFGVSMEGGKPVMSFKSEAARRSYKLTKPVTNMNIILEIDAPWNRNYKVEMKKQ